MTLEFRLTTRREQELVMYRLDLSATKQGSELSRTCQGLFVAGRGNRSGHWRNKAVALDFIRPFNPSHAHVYLHSPQSHVVAAQLSQTNEAQAVIAARALETFGWSGRGHNYIISKPISSNLPSVIRIATRPHPNESLPTIRKL